MDPQELNARGTQLIRAVTIRQPADRLFAAWKQWEEFPRWMPHLLRVEPFDELRSRWTLQTIEDQELSWDAHIINEVPSRLLAWETLTDGHVQHAGTVEFIDAPAGRGTVVRLTARYQMPTGGVAANLGKIIGMEPSQLAAETLRNFKQLMETGELATIDGQPSGRAARRTARPPKTPDEVPAEAWPPQPAHPPELIAGQPTIIVQGAA